MGGFFRPCADGVDLYVRLTPRSSADAVEGIGVSTDGSRHLKARVRAVPENGAANAALEKLVAAWLDLPKRNVTLFAGRSSRLKTLRITGDAGEIAARITMRAGS
jgi:uncharacterized protein YggU (UPF0235/DUF167 family)